MRLIQFFLILYLSSNISAQNLVPNANFEEYSACPTDISDFTALNWTSPFWPGTPNYFNVCNNGQVGIPVNELGNQESSTGAAYVGIYTYGLNTREFIQAALISPTIAGVTYELTMVYSAADNFGHSNGLGMLLSAGSPTNYMGQIPQLEKSTIVESQSDWHTITFEYLSPGGETHITIGNFNTDINSNFVPEGMYQDNAYYYIDSIAVKCKSIPSGNITPDLGEDVELCDNDYPYTIVNNLPAAYNEWSTGETGNSINVYSPGLYFVKSIVDCQYGIDTIVITTIPEPTIFTDDTVCVKDKHTIQLDPESGNFRWSDGTQGPELVATQSGIYAVTLTHTCGVTEDSFYLNVEAELEEPGLENTYLLCQGEELPIVFESSYSVRWNDGSIAEERILYEPGFYSVRITNTCIDTSFNFELRQEDCFYIPNAFSPNNDGVNDYFSVEYSEAWDPPSIKFTIYDRWGETVYYSEDPNFKWHGDFNGQLLDSGVFIYYYEFKTEANGITQLKTGSGDITILK